MYHSYALCRRRQRSQRHKLCWQLLTEKQFHFLSGPTHPDTLFLLILCSAPSTPVIVARALLTPNMRYRREFKLSSVWWAHAWEIVPPHLWKIGFRLTLVVHDAYIELRLIDFSILAHLIGDWCPHDTHLTAVWGTHWSRVWSELVETALHPPGKFE